MIIGTLNIAHCNFSDVSKICDFLKTFKVDTLFLQEIDVITRRSGFINQYETIRKRLEYKNGFFCPSFSFQDGGEYGIAIMSKKNISKLEMINLSFYLDKEPRFAIKAEISGIDGVVLTTHLSRDVDINRLQLLQLLNNMDSEKWIIAGDLNMGTDALEATIKFNPKVYDYTWPTMAPEVRFDHIISNDMRRINVKTVSTDNLTDHNFVFAEVVDAL